jgi:hypothetical protein
MQVEAIYSHGRIELTQPLRLKHDYVRVIVDVPDDEIDSQIPQYNLPAETISRGQPCFNSTKPFSMRRCHPMQICRN